MYNTSCFFYNFVLLKYYIWSQALCTAESCTLRKVDQKCLQSLEMWYWRRVEFDRFYHVRNEVLQRGKEERNILHTIKRRMASLLGHILRRNCRLKHVIEGMIKKGIEVKGRRGRSRKQLLGDFKKTTQDTGN